MDKFSYSLINLVINIDLLILQSSCVLVIDEIASSFFFGSDKNGSSNSVNKVPSGFDNFVSDSISWENF